MVSFRRNYEYAFEIVDSESLIQFYKRKEFICH